MLLFNYNINVFDSTVKLVDVCVTANTHTFLYAKNRVDREIYSIDLCMITISLCLIAPLVLVVVAVKVLI